MHDYSRTTQYATRGQGRGVKRWLRGPGEHGEPQVELTGIPEQDRDGNIIGRSVYEALLDAYESMPRARRRDPEAVAEALRRAARAAVSSAWRKKPICHVQVVTV